MGTWGPKLYQDDIAQDVKDSYIDQLHRGKLGKEITQELIKQNEYMISDPDDAPIFWIALADTQWSLGRLEDPVKEKALYYIHNECDIKRWELENPKEASARAKELYELEKKLLLPQPTEKKVPQYKLYKCEWEIGSAYAYKLESDLAKERGLDGEYFIIQKVDEGIWHPGHVIPIVRAKITKNGMLPQTTEEFNELEYVQTSFSRFDPISPPIEIDTRGMTPEEYQRRLLEEKSKLEFDEFGLLPEFRIALITTSKRVIPKKLIHLGNFYDANPPELNLHHIAS